MEKLITIFFLFLIPPIIYLVWTFTSGQITPSEETVAFINNFILLAAFLYYTLLWLYFCLIFIDYYLDVWVVTNMRILDVEQKGLFNREVSECYISKIQDITVQTKGVMATFLKYGDLHIQTAAEKREFVFEEISEPEKVKNVILEQYNKSTHN